MMKGLVKIGGVTVVGAILTGCASTSVSNLSSYDKVDLPEAEQMPSKEAMQSGKKKVVVYKVEDNGIDEAQKFNLNAAMTAALEQKVSKSASLVDRQAAKELKKEIQTAERSGSSSYQGPQVADYAVKAVISQANFGSSYTEAQTTEEGDRIPPQCNYSAEVTGTLKVYKVPSLTVAKTIRLEGDSGTSSETRGGPSSCNASGESLLRTAAEEAVNAKRTVFQNFFAPQGYVITRRHKEEDNLFKTTLGEKLGAKEGRTVHIIRVKEVKNELTGETQTQKSKITEALITNKLGKNYSWIRVSEPKKADKIKMGDRVKPLYEKGWMESGAQLVN